MLAVLVGLVSGVTYGFADFFGGLASRRLGAVLATAIAAVAGLVVYLVIELVVGGVLSPEAVGYGVLSGVFGAIAIGLLYACLAIGPMSILSPLTAVVSAIVPVVWAATHGETIGPLSWTGLGVGVVAIVLVAFVPGGVVARPSLRALLMAFGSGAAIGAFLIAIDAAPDDSGLWPMILNRATNGTIMLLLAGVLAILAVARRRRDGTAAPTRDWRRGLQLAIVCGVIDGLANAGLLLGVRIGDLSVMGVLTALYPVGTILLARLVLKERIAPVQVVGLVLVLVASALLALG